MAECMLSSDDRNFWAEIKKIRRNRSGRSRVVDGMSNDSSIADVFVQSYKELFTSVPYNKLDMQHIHVSLLKRLTKTMECTPKLVTKVTVSEK